MPSRFASRTTIGEARTGITFLLDVLGNRVQQISFRLHTSQHDTGFTGPEDFLHVFYISKRPHKLESVRLLWV